MRKYILTIPIMVTRRERSRSSQRPGRSEKPDEHEDEQVVPIAGVDLSVDNARDNDMGRSRSSIEVRRVPQLEEARRYLSIESQRIRRLSNSSPCFSPFVYNEDTREWELRGIDNPAVPCGSCTELTSNTRHLLMDSFAGSPDPQQTSSSGDWLGSRDSSSSSTHHTLPSMPLDGVSTRSSSGQMSHTCIEQGVPMNSTRNHLSKRQRGNDSQSSGCEPSVVKTVKNNLCSSCHKKLVGAKLDPLHRVIVCRLCYRRSVKSKKPYIYK